MNSSILFSRATLDSSLVLIPKQSASLTSNLEHLKPTPLVRGDASQSPLIRGGTERGLLRKNTSCKVLVEILRLIMSLVSAMLDYG